MIHLFLEKTYNRIAVTAVDLDDYDLALQYYNKALKIRQANLPPMDKSIASIYHNMGQLYHRKEEFAQALKYYNDALNIYKTVLPPKHPSINQIEKNISHLKKQVNK